MHFPKNYSLDLNEKRISNYFPNLKLGENFIYTSLKTDVYNCVAWSLKIDGNWIEYDLNVDDYVSLFFDNGFRRSENTNFMDGVEKIAIYVDDKNLFTHVARQLDTGKWTSKFGEWEDIEHDTLEAIEGSGYGRPYLIMEK